MGTNQFVGRFPKALPEGATLPRLGFSSGTVLSLSLRKAHRTTAPSPRSEGRTVYARRRGRVRGYASTACPHANLTTPLFVLFLLPRSCDNPWTRSIPRTSENPLSTHSGE